MLRVPAASLAASERTGEDHFSGCACRRCAGAAFLFSSSFSIFIALATSTSHQLSLGRCSLRFLFGVFLFHKLLQAFLFRHLIPSGALQSKVGICSRFARSFTKRHSCGSFFAYR